LKLIALSEAEIKRITGLLLNGDEPGDFKLACAVVEGKRDAVAGVAFAETVTTVTTVEVKE
jgi:hypothetical protein